MKTINETTNKLLQAAQVGPGPAPKPADSLCLPSCPICGGAGWIRYEVPFGHPKYGRIDPCPKAPPESRLFDNHGLTVYERKTLTWNQIRKRENVEGAIEQVARSLQRGRGVGYLYGGKGLAKTLLLKTACATWTRLGGGVFHFTTLADVLEDLRTAYDDDEPQRALKAKEEKYFSYPMLAIDEIGAQRLTDFGTEKFFSLINRRHESGTERGESRLTLMAGNVSPKEIDSRITDRLEDGRNFVYKLTGESYRPKLEWKDNDERN